VRSYRVDLPTVAMRQLLKAFPYGEASRHREPSAIFHHGSGARSELAHSSLILNDVHRLPTEVAEPHGKRHDTVSVTNLDIRALKMGEKFICIRQLLVTGD
jgi:hypothetical protein